MTTGSTDDPAVIEFGEFRLDRQRNRLQRNGEFIKLATKPCEVLAFLAMNHEQVVSKEEILEVVWGNRNADPNLVQQNIRQIRLAVEDDPKQPRWIVTVGNDGYRMAGPVTFHSPDAKPERFQNGFHRTTPITPPETQIAIRRFPMRLAAAGVLVFFGAVVVLYAMAPGEPAACEISVNTLKVKDGQGRDVWKFEFPKRLNDAFYSLYPPLCRFTDVTKDGIADVVFAAKFAPSNGYQTDTLYGFVTPPKLFRALHATPSHLLTFQPGVGLLVGPQSDPKANRPYTEYLPPWSIENVFSSTAVQGEPRIVVSTGMGEAPDQIAVLDGGFVKQGEYWHAGALKYGQFAVYHGQERLLLGGVNNGYHAATFIAFDLNHVVGTTDLSIDLPDRAPQFGLLKAGTREQLEPLAPGSETCRVIFSRTCIAKAKPHIEPYNRLIGLRITDGRIVATIAESEKEESRIRVAYEMDRHLNLIEAEPTTEFRQRHLELEQAGLLDHAFSVDELKPLVHVLPGCEFVESRR